MQHGRGRRDERKIYWKTYARAMVPMTTLDNIIKGNTTNPGIYTICKICDGLEMTLQDLLEGEESEK